MNPGIVFHLLAALAYATLGLVVWQPMLRGATARVLRLRWHWLLGALLLHGAGLQQTLLLDNRLMLGWALALSAAVWLGLLVFWLENFVMQLDSLLLILLPAAAISSLAAGVFPQGGGVAYASDGWLRLHLGVALVGYGLMTVAAVQAMLMTALERQLHRPGQGHAQRGLLDRALDAMPPLLVQERLLFRLIWVGFLALTLTVITGAVTALRLRGLLLPMDHKTVFTLLSWGTFGLLLLGRYLYGWRGRIALRWTLTGFAFLLLAYTGTHFVLEVLLRR